MELSNLYPWINFLIFAGGLFYLLKEPIRDFLGDRRGNLKKEVEEVSKQRTKIEGRFQEYRKKLAEAESEINQLKKEVRQEGELEKTNLIQKAKTFAAKIREDANKVTNQELNRAKLILQKKTLLLAVGLAKEWVEKSISSEDQERLFAIAVEQLERGDHEGKSAS